MRLFFILLFVAAVQANSKELDNRVNLLFGLNQPLLGGFNIEGNYFFDRFVLDYSHGVSLNLPNNAIGSEAGDQQLEVHIPWTTGFGIGYRFNEWLNLRVEPKWHKFELFFDGEEQMDANLITSYETFSLGLGLYGNFRPFKKWGRHWEGIMIAPSIRYWPRISSTLKDNTLQYTNERTNQVETHEALEVGIANTPLIFNISVGYSLKL